MKTQGLNESIWHNEMSNYVERPAVYDNVIFDVLVIGGGITGITTALLLQQQGKKCVLAEAETLGFGTTGGTTAHLNNFFDCSYSKVSKNFGVTNSGLLAKGAADAIHLIKNNVRVSGSDCGFEEKNAFLFAINEDQRKQMDEMVEAGKIAGVPMKYINDSPFPIPYLKIACIEKQAQFHPLQYIFSLAKAFEEAGGVVLQNCRVADIEEGTILKARTNKGILSAKNAVYATHVPPVNKILQFKTEPYKSYAIAVQLTNDEYPDALGYDMGENYHYYRTQEINGQKYLIAGGEDHKASSEDNTKVAFRRLESYVKSYFQVASVDFKWSSEYYETIDGLPYIGTLPGEVSNVFVATGFGGNGLVFGSLAGIILSDLIVKNQSEYSNLFKPERSKYNAGSNSIDIKDVFYKHALATAV